MQFNNNFKKAIMAKANQTQQNDHLFEHLKTVCVLDGGVKQCKYLAVVDCGYNQKTFFCAKPALELTENGITEFIEAWSKIPHTAEGDNCLGNKELAKGLLVEVE
jgi:hypothetical protein